ncbi:hypothetical protein JCM12296A_25040 [Desulfosarcina cetonica]|uniref:hypothetical protein n=1 Tax=Desulfosarcina cetonica TaxID=90730 RepID=UPI001C4372A6|nr:hypothetical protein [Desulfosarcina cetonica]
MDVDDTQDCEKSEYQADFAKGENGHAIIPVIQFGFRNVSASLEGTLTPAAPNTSKFYSFLSFEPESSFFSK